MRHALFIILAGSLVLTSCTGFGRTSPDTSLTNGADDQQALIARVNPTITKGLSRPEKDVLADAESRALNFAQAGDPVRWVGDNSKTKGEIRAQATFRVGGNTCRKFSHVVTTDGETRRGSATACRQGDDSWQLIT
ncbi:LipA protein [Ahrensia sp. R2A130]|uniref:LipA protein n=1 Tax=Ahrensia sp. R2A130 TaxID=744979 RepID=UPI0001E0E8CF|nr:LipA protein [Ahrensia sp. R2A130]EFL88973.1 LipA protein [Ahrensia sp. R2A130]